MKTNAFRYALAMVAMLLSGLCAIALPGGWAATPTPSAPSTKSTPAVSPGESDSTPTALAPESVHSSDEAALLASQNLKGAAVTFDGDTLYYVYTPLGPYSPEERAEITSKRILRLAQDPLFDEGMYTIELEDDKARIYYRGTLAGVVTPEEAAAAGTTPEDLAEQRIDIIEKAIDAYRRRRLPSSLLLAAVKLVVSTICLIALLVGGMRLHRSLLKRVRARRVAVVAARERKERISLLDRTLGIQVQALRLLRPIAIVILVVVYLQYAFLLIPLTRSFARGVLSYVLDPLARLGQGILDNVGNFAFILVVLALTTGLLRLLRWVVSEIEQGSITVPGLSPEWAKPMHRLVRLMVLAIVVVVIYPYIPGSSTAAFKGVGLFAGALFTVGASSTAGNFIGGIALMFSGTFRIGDRVMIGKITGDVVETGVLITRIRTSKNETVSIPNGTLLSGELVNYSAMAREGRLILHTSITIGYDVPWRKVHELLVQAARRTSGIEAYPEPFVLQKDLSDFFVEYEINAYTRKANSMAVVYGELHQNIQDVFNEAGVEIMSPHYGSLRDGNVSTIPESYRRQGEEARPFVVRMDNGEKETEKPKGEKEVSGTNPDEGP